MLIGSKVSRDLKEVNQNAPIKAKH